MRPVPPAFHLTLRLFGPFDVRVNGEPMPPLRTRKGEWLLALLALRPGRTLSRDWLAGTLWPDSREEQALSSLRRALTDLRAALGTAAESIEAPTPRTLRLNLENVALDTFRFEEAARLHTDEALEQAVALYRGPLLEGCTEEWAIAERTEREETYLRCRLLLAQHAVARADFDTAVENYRAIIHTDPLRENAQRGLMEAQAASGDFAAALQSYRELRLRLHREYAAEPSPETTKLFQNLRRSAQARIPNPTVAPKVPLPPASAASDTAANGTSETDADPVELPRHLPHFLTLFVGREQEMLTVTRTMRNRRLVTLTGIGGIGKTRLAVRCAERLLDTRSELVADGAYFVDLAAITNPAMIVREVAKTLAVIEESGQPLTETLTAALGERRLLLVLDNCEHLLEPCAMLTAALMQACPHLRILATSREPLGILGETLWRVPPMELPDADTPATRPAFCHEAVLLFVDRAEMVQPDFLLTPEHGALVLQICRRLDGVALAIELAAARLASLSLEEVASRLEVRLLREGNRAAVPRQRTLSATLDWSYDLLSADEQLLLRRLSVFAGSAPFALIPSVCFPETKDAEKTTPPWLVQDILASLVAKSLLVRQENDSADSPRYRLLEVVRQYAAERLAQACETLPTQTRHFDAFTGMVQQSFAVINGPEQAAAMQRLTADRENIRAALGWVFAPERHDDTERLLNGQRITRAMTRVWAVQNALTEAQQWCERALSAPCTVSPLLPADERTVQERVIGIERSRVVSYAGIIARRLGDYTTARTYQQESLRLARQFHDEDMICTALGNLALLAENQGDYETAQQFRTEGMNIERARDNKTQLLNFLQNAGNIAQRLGDYETADAHFTECLALHEKLGDEEGHIWALFGLAETLEQRGQTSNARPNDAERATRIRTEAIARAQKFGDKEAIVYGLAMRAASSAEQGDLSGAYRDLADCLTTLEGMEGSSVLCEPLNAASLIAYQSGAATIAAQLFALLEATNERANTCPTPKEQRDLDHFRDSLCLTLGEADFAAAREAGRNLTTVEAVVLARTVL